MPHRHPSGPFLSSLPASISRQPPILIHLSPLQIWPGSSSFTSHPPPRSHGRLTPRCGSEGWGNAAGPRDLLKGFVGEQVEAQLRKEENRALLDGLEDASRRVEAGRRALADIQRQEAEAARAKEYVLQLESRQSEVAESQRELLDARSMVEEAERSLSLNMVRTTFGDAFMSNETEEINKEIERLESVKASLVSSIVGTLACLPISLYQMNISQLVAHLAVIFISCALFGVTFRYTIRTDLDNIQLKTGTCAAFGFVRGLSAVAVSKPWQIDSTSLMSLAVDGAIHVLESTFIFIFSAVALDYCFKMGLLRPFPAKK